MTSEMRSLLDHRLIIVTGKGGVGKTTVACLLAEAARRTGMRVLLAETAPIEAVASRFEPDPEPLGYEGRELRPGLHAIRIDPHEALAHYVRLQTGLGLVTDRILGSEIFRQLLEAAPGWRELILLGKLWHVEQSQEGGRPEYDLIVVDAPATGHGLTFLDVPRVAQQAVRAGPLARHAGWVEELVHDRERTLLLPVTLPEELPVRETVELVNRAREDIDIGVDRVIVNRLPPRPSPALREVLAGSDISFEAWPPPAALAPLVEHAASRAALAEAERVSVSTRCDLPVVDVPILPGGLEGGTDWSEFADGIVVQPVRPATEQAGESAA